MSRLVLASGSPRRSDLLGRFGIPFEVMPADIDEGQYPGEEPYDLVERLARMKASRVVEPGVVGVGADTVVVCEGRVLGKPGHPAEAVSMLRRLSGDTHLVLTGVACAWSDDREVLFESSVAQAVVRFSELTDSEIDWYVSTGEPLDKAGAYGIGQRGGMFVESIEGHPTTVAGLPLPLTRQLLARRGLAPR